MAKDVAMIKKSAMLSIPAIFMMLVLTASLSLLTLHFRGILLESYQVKLKQVAEITARILYDDFEIHEPESIEYNVLASDVGSSVGMRVTIIDELGVVLGDSQVPERQIDNISNHADRIEFIDAMQEGTGYSTRYSATKGYYLMYYALKLDLSDIYDYNTYDDEFESEVDTTFTPAIETFAATKGIYVIRTALPLILFTDEMLWIWIAVMVISLLGVLIVIAITRFFKSLLDQQASAERRVLEAEVKERTHELSLMQRLGSLMSACTTIDRAANVVHPIAEHLLPGCKSGAITLIKSSRNRLDVITQWGEEWQGSEWFEPSDCWSLLKGHTHYSLEDGLEIHCAHNHEAEELYQVCIPLVAQGETLGVLHLNYESQAALNRSISKAESMAEQIGLALANMRLREDLRQQAIRDPLTGLFNRRHMMDFLEQYSFSTETQNNALSVMMIDLDHFKRFNDTFGHDAGDYVLKQVAIELRSTVKDSDLVCRYGGEEICLVCPDTTIEEAATLAERLVLSVSGHGMQFNGQSLGNITISVGVAARLNSELNHDLLIKQADDALYQAKEEGRNRVVISKQSQGEKALKVNQGDKPD